MTVKESIGNGTRLLTQQPVTMLFSPLLQVAKTWQMVSMPYLPTPQVTTMQ